MVENKIKVVKLIIGKYSSSFFISSLFYKNNYSHSKVLKGTISLRSLRRTSSVLTSKYNRISGVKTLASSPLYRSM